jgi:hypothetical protein
MHGRTNLTEEQEAIELESRHNSPFLGGRARNIDAIVFFVGQNWKIFRYCVVQFRGLP